jgi:LmbE family N-acetylglucosaminyl deacetylase
MHDDADRDAAVEAHLGALDDEIARLRAMEEAMDRRIEAAEEERRAVERGERPPEPGPPAA